LHISILPAIRLCVMLPSALPDIYITPRMMIEILVRSEVLMSSVKARLILAYAFAPPLTVDLALFRGSENPIGCKVCQADLNEAAGAAADRPL
jgi:hypothetical protein